MNEMVCAANPSAGREKKTLKRERNRVETCPAKKKVLSREIIAAKEKKKRKNYRPRGNLC
jgi:hypothetical protein